MAAEHIIEAKLPSERTIKQLNAEFIELLREFIERSGENESQRVFLADNHDLNDKKTRDALISELDAIEPSSVRTMFRIEIEGYLDADHLYESANDLITSCFHRQLAAIEAGHDQSTIKYMFCSGEYLDELQQARSSAFRNMVENGSLMATFRLLQSEKPGKSFGMLLG